MPESSRIPVPWVRPNCVVAAGTSKRWTVPAWGAILRGSGVEPGLPMECLVAVGGFGGSLDRRCIIQFNQIQSGGQFGDRRST